MGIQAVYTDMGPQCLRQPHRLCTSHYPNLGCLPLNTQPHICVQHVQTSLWPVQMSAPQEQKSQIPRSVVVMGITEAHNFVPSCGSGLP